MRRTAVVICPGRGTYGPAELGSLVPRFPDGELLADFEAIRISDGLCTLAELDGADRFVGSQHTRSDNASALIFAASYGDFLSIDRTRIDVVAVTGNSMGWYTALACAGALAPVDAFRVANTMGRLMQAAAIGGQVVYPWMDDNWGGGASRRAEILATVARIDGQDGAVLKPSVELGGMLVLAGNNAGLRAFEAAVDPVGERFPMRLANHAAFHTALQEPVAAQAREILHPSVVQPSLPLIDGRGAIWWPGATDTEALWSYTLGAQVTETYDFTRAIRIAAQEFAPDLFIVTGPGTNLGGAVAQSLVLASWRGITDKARFKDVQDRSILLVSMGLDTQRRHVIREDSNVT
ncbi:MAG: ACP S-malonyltransferase [Gemmobacter sp.]